jgi:hypothetical protein
MGFESDDMVVTVRVRHPPLLWVPAYVRGRNRSRANFAFDCGQAPAVTGIYQLASAHGVERPWEGGTGNRVTI